MFYLIKDFCNKIWIFIDVIYSFILYKKVIVVLNVNDWSKFLENWKYFCLSWVFVKK